MAISTVLVPPDPAVHTAPGEYSQVAAAFAAALVTWTEEVNETEIAGTLGETQDTSASSNSIGTGAKTFTVTAGKSFIAGMWLVIADTAAPTTNYMVGSITSYSGTTLIMSIVVTSGSGTKTAWTISQCAPGGASLGTNTFTGGQNLARGTLAMHATTMDPWGQPNTIDGTGSPVTVTAIANAPQAGARRTLYPIAGSIITNGATFAVDGAANHTAASGDCWEFEAITTSTYKVHIKKKDGTAIVATQTSVLLATLTPTVSANVDALNVFTSDYDTYLIVGQGITPSADDRTLFRFAVAGAVDSSNAYAALEGAAANTGSTALAGGTSASGPIRETVEATTSKGANFQMWVFNANATTQLKSWDAACQVHNASGVFACYRTTGGFSAANAITGIRLFWNSGSNFQAVGKIHIYGLRNA